LNGEHEYNEGFVKYTSQSLLGFAKKEQKPADKVEPKFKVGDTITSSRNNVIKYLIKEVGIENELGELDYVVEDVSDSEFRGSIRHLSIKKADEWAVLCEEKKPAWSEEDEKMWLQIINEMEAIKSNSSTIFEKNIAQDKIDLLKSIKSKHWKPSKKQIKVLIGVYDYNQFQIVDSLYSDLQKLLQL